MGLGSPGRGRVRQAVEFGGLHVVGAALGGMLAGAVLGGVGSVLGLDAWRTWLVGATALIAFGLGLRRQPISLGRQRQVPREWSQTMPPGRRYLLWGAMLGAGVATPIFTSALLVLSIAQMTTGLALGALSGAVFGGTREGMALLPSLCRLDSSATMALLTTFRSTVRRLNAVVALAAGLVLVLLAWH